MSKSRKPRPPRFKKPRVVTGLTYGDGSAVLQGPTTLFTHVEDRPEGVLRRTWHIEKLAYFAKHGPFAIRTTAPITDSMAGVIMDRRGIEGYRLERMTHLNLLEPLLFVEQEHDIEGRPPVSHLLVDGNHRFMFAHRTGIPQLPAIVIPERFANAALILGLPETHYEGVLSRPSNIK